LLNTHSIHYATYLAGQWPATGSKTLIYINVKTTNVTKHSANTTTYMTILNTYNNIT